LGIGCWRASDGFGEALLTLVIMDDVALLVAPRYHKERIDP
jgi:hypothetical protein